MSHNSAKPNLAAIAGMLRYARPYRRQWLLISALTLLATGAALLLPWPMQILVDYVLGSVPIPPALASLIDMLPGFVSSRALIGLVVVGGFALVLLNAALDALLTYVSVRVGQGMVYDLAQDLFAQVQRRSLLFHTRSNVGDLLARVTGDTFCVFTIVDLLLLGPARAIIMTALMVGIMLHIEWRLTLIALAAAPLMAAASSWLAPPIRTASKLRREIESRLLSHVQQTLSGIPVVQAFSAEDREHRRFRDFADAAIGAQKRTTFAGQFHQLGTGFVATVGAAVVLWFGISQVLAGTLTLGIVLVFIAYLNQLQEQMKTFVGLWAAVQTVSANVDRVNEILRIAPEVRDTPHAKAIDAVRGEVRFERVSFGYDADRPVLHEIDLHIPAGTTLAIVGPSGAGKSTLAALVPRFFDPASGRITLDGHDLRDLKLESLRKHVAVVLQEPFLFPLTVAQNIAYGRPDATRDEIEAAAIAAGADAFIRRLPQGYDTSLGERGACVSGGERQRIAIARALLKDAPVLILDEPTASLDAQTEAGLLEALKVLMRNRTTLVIAHRLSTIRNADRILVLDQGRVAEVGAHEELLELNGIYADLYSKQTGRRRAALVVEGATA